MFNLLGFDDNCADVFCSFLEVVVRVVENARLKELGRYQSTSTGRGPLETILLRLQRNKCSNGKWSLTIWIGTITKKPIPFSDREFLVDYE